MTDHAILSASGAARWINCPGSIRISAGIPSASSEYAEEGTAAHEVAKLAFEGGRDAAFFIGGKIPVGKNSYPVTKEMAAAVQVMLDTVRADLGRAGAAATLLVEHQFKLDWLREGLWGTNDAMVKQPFGTLHVYDYKHGKGVAVDVDDNAQMMYYALGAAHDEDYADVELIIVQPRAIHPDGPVRRCRMSVDSLEQWAREVLLPAAIATDDPEAPLHIGEHCKFCPALAICPAQRAQAMTVAKGVFDVVPMTPAPVETLSHGDLKRILDAKSTVEAWLKSISEYVHNLLETGQASPEELGYKIVEGRATRSWKDEAATEKFLLMLLDEEAYVPKKLISPAQVEGILKGKENKEALAAFVESTRGKQLAPLSDKRPAVKPALAAFDEVKVI